MRKFKNNLELIVLAIALILFWRGVWGLADIYLFPGNETLSFISSIVIGLFVLYVNDKKLNELL